MSKNNSKNTGISSKQFWTTAGISIIISVVSTLLSFSYAAGKHIQKISDLEKTVQEQKTAFNNYAIEVNDSRIKTRTTFDFILAHMKLSPEARQKIDEIKNEVNLNGAGIQPFNVLPSPDDDKIQNMPYQKQ